MLPAAAVDHRADIFSVGVMLYELLTGQLPRGVFRPLAQVVPAARGLDRVVTRALQGDPAKRYAAMRELSAELAVCDPPGRNPKAWLAATLLAMTAAGAAAWHWRPKPPIAPAPAPAPFVNSLGLRFVPAGTRGVLFCTTETRVRDFTAFASARELPAFPMPMWVNYAGGDDGWKMVKATWREPGFSQTGEHPVVGITQDEAADFCEWLTAHERASGRIGAEDRYRLPTDAEWSVAVGLDADTLFPSGRHPWGTAFPPTAQAGNYASEEIRTSGKQHAVMPVIAGYRDGHAFTAPVGSYAPDARGLHDLGGNAWEWIDNGTEPKGALRGGGWWDANPEKLDAACRIVHDRELRCYAFGFRLVLDRKKSATGSRP